MKTDQDSALAHSIIELEKALRYLHHAYDSREAILIKGAKKHCLFRAEALADALIAEKEEK